MAFFALLWKARTIEKYKLNYEKEKINSIVMGNTRMEQTLSQRWRHYRYDTQKRISSTFKKWYPEGSGVANFFLYLKTDQTFPNFLLKSLMGFVGGIILTYICFMFFVFQLSISLIHSTIMSSIIGVLLTLGLAFSYRIRCLVFLLIPQFFSRVGRYTLTCYALVLILTGPATNTLKNSEVLSESMACSQEQIKTSVHHLNDLSKKPHNSMKESIKLMIDRFKVITTRVQQMVLRLNRLVFSIVGLIQYSFSWLQAISNICNEKLGSPYDRCTTLLREGMADRTTNFEPNIAVHYSMPYLAEFVCGAIKPFKAFCCVTDFMDDAILANIRKKLKDFTAQVRALFHVEVHIHRSYAFKSNNTRSASQMAAGIVTEIRNRTGPLLTWLSWSSCVTSLFLLLIIFRAKYYQHMYETRSRFDNRYITKELQELDLKRQRQGRETVLPLNRRERAKYITTTSFRLVASEKMYLTRSAVFMLITTFKLLIHIVADYSLYWVLMTIRYHGQYQSNLMRSSPFLPAGVPNSGAHVTGSGFVARLFRSIVDTFTIPLAKPSPSLIPCLPDPYPPDFRRYTQIGVLIFLLWFFALFEPYGLRLRHLIMGQYRPERAKARATWLYNHILRTRAGFMKFARRKLHRKYKYTTESSLTFRHWLNDHIPFQCLKYLLGVGPKEPFCLLCGTTSSPNDSDTQLTMCETPNCPGVYCTNCFSDIGQLCTICLSPNDYGDLSDLSLERGSSDDDDDDSGSEFDGNVNISECIRLLENENHERLLNAQGSVGRWNFFLDSQKTSTQKNIAPKEPTDTENRNIYTYSLKNGHLTELSRINQQELQNNYLVSEDDIKIYNFSLDFNNNIILEPPKEKIETLTEVKSIGTNTDKRYSLMAKINLNNIFKTITIYKKQSMKKVKDLRPTMNNKTFHNIDNLNLVHNDSKRTKNHIVGCKINTKHKSFTTFKADSECVMKRKDSKISTWNVVRGIINIVRILNESNSHLNSTNCNKNEDSNKDKGEHNFQDMKPIMSSTPKNNDLKKNVKDNKRKTKGIEKNSEDIEKKKMSNSKKNSENNKPKKSCKDISKKTSKHRIAIFHAFFSNHWRTVKSNIGFLTNRHVENVKLKEKKNHKRRKKWKDSNNYPEKIEKEKKDTAKKDSKRTRNYRISAFLADHEWMKRDYKRPNKVNIGSDDSCRVMKAPSCRVIPPIRNKTKLVAMVQVNNRPFQWRDEKVTESVTELTEFNKNNGITKSKSQACLKRKSSVKALERFKRRVNAPELSPAPSILKEMMNSMSLMRKSSLNVDTSSICIKKRKSFYNTFKREATKLKDCGTLDTVELFKNKGYSDLLIPLEFKPKLSDTNANSKIEKKISLSTPSVLQKIGSKNTDLGEKTTLMPCRFDSFKDILKKWNLIKKPREKSASDKMYDVTQKFKTLCTSLLGSSCDELTCEKRKQRVAVHKRPGKCQSIISNNSEIVQNNSIVRRCNCEPYEDIQRKWTHINNSPEACQTDRKLSFKQRTKNFCSSRFASSCNEKTCYNHKERERILNENRLCKKEEIKIKTTDEKKCDSKVKDRARKNKDCVKKCVLEDIKDLSCKDVLICQKREEAKLKEIQRHIEREKEIEREIALEQKRHREREKEIEKELGYELAKHRETEKKLMCDEDSQTHQGVETGVACESTTMNTKGERCEATTQPSVIQQKSAAVGSVCECKDKKVGEKNSCSTPPKQEKRKRDKKKKITCACPAPPPCEIPRVCCRPLTSAGVGSCNCLCDDKNVGGSAMLPCSCATQCKTSGIKLSNVYPKCQDLPSPKEITPYRSSTSPSCPKSPPCPKPPPCPNSPPFTNSPPNPEPSPSPKPSPCPIPPPCPKPPPCETSPLCPNTSDQSVTSVVDCCCTRAYKQANKASPGKKKKVVKCECSTQYSNQDVQNRTCFPMFPKFVSHQVSPMHFSQTAPSHTRLSPKRTMISESTSPQMVQADEAARSRPTRVQKNSGRVSGEVKTRIIYTPQYKNNIRPEEHRVRNPSARCLPRRSSPHSQPKQFSAPQQQQQQRRSRVPEIASQHSSISHLSPLLLLTTPSLEVLTPREKKIEQPPMTIKTRVTRKRSPLTIRIPVQISDALNLAPRIRDTPMDSGGYCVNKSVFKNKSITANFSEEILPPKSQFQQIAVQAKLEPEFIRKRSPSPTIPLLPLNKEVSSEDYAVMLPSSGVRVSARSKHPPDNIIKFSFKKNRSGADTKPQYANKIYHDTSQCHNEKREKTKADKTAPHKGTRYNYCWKRFGRKSSASTKSKENTKLRRLSLESSLCDLDDQSILNELMEDSDSNIASASCLFSDEGFKTDTTYCSMATVHFSDRRCHHHKVKFVTNNDQATSTEKTVLRDTGTITCDWWSPLVERKGHNLFEKKTGYNEIEDVRRGIIDGKRRKPNTADGRFVKFQSGTQIIPPWRFDFSNLNIMTPSRYLLESQRYYNELFAYATNMPRADVHRYQHQTQKVHDREKVRSPIGSRRAYQRKTKRLDECYSPRKSLYSPRRRLTDSVRTSESPRIRSSVYRKSIKRYYAKLNAAKKPYY
ncbi:unnamed protein product [Arctia plantaginis]|uniref:Dendritic cell-specific transmembrane protein-like domain-containing protein n=1 Tax=Arctia plantaginis TaxID=874455 RepID=A0A8S1BDD9_ARCPL|nr:unnamed protein product [Arctia plantaginis]